MEGKSKLTTTTGLHKNIQIPAYSSVEDFDADAGKPGAALEEANFNVIWRDTLPTLHEKVSPLIEKLTGIARGVNEKATAKSQDRENAAAKKANREPKKVKDVPETFNDYDARVQASVDEDVWKQVDELVRATALETPASAKPSTRSAGASKANLEKADDVLSRSDDDIETAVSKLMALVPTFDLERDGEGKPDRMSLARLVGAYVEASKAGV